MFASTTLSLEDILRYAIAIVVFASVILAVIYSIWGGFLIITSGGNEEKVKPAVNHIRHAVIGLIVLVLCLFFVPKVLDIFGIPYGNSFHPTIVFRTIREVSAKAFGTRASDSVYQDTNGDIQDLPSNFSEL